MKLGRYISIFLLTILIGVVVLLFVIPLILGDLAGDFDIVIGIIIIIIGSFIITQLFYIIDLLHKNKR